MTRLMVVAVAVVLCVGLAGAAGQSRAQEQMMGPVLTGTGVGSGMIYGWPDPARNPLSVEDVRAMLEDQLAWHRNPRLKVGDISEKDDDTITAEIVTVDDSLVQKFEISRHSGQMWQVD